MDTNSHLLLMMFTNSGSDRRGFSGQEIANLIIASKNK